VTIHAAPKLVSLRRPRIYAALQDALALGQRRWFRIVHFSVQRNHVHLIVETPDKRSLSCGTKGLSVRIARVYNRVQHRRGCVIRDRFHARELTTSRQVRTVLVYLLQNWRKAHPWIGGLDDLSSAAWFGGWDEETRIAMSGWAADRTRGSPWRCAAAPPPVAIPRDSRTRWAAARRARASGSPLVPVVAPTTDLLSWLWRARGGGEISMLDTPRIPEWDDFVPTR
jgi:REP element-mobilizing transposase RayT